MSVSQNNNYQINSYLIVNRTNENIVEDTIDNDVSKNNYATIKSSSYQTNHEIDQDKIFNNIERVSHKNIPVKSRRNDVILKLNSSVNELQCFPWNSDIHEAFKNYIKIGVDPYTVDSIEGISIEWKKIAVEPSESKIIVNVFSDLIRLIKQGSSKNCSLMSGIISICNYFVKQGKNLLYPILYPQKDGSPIISKFGIYGLKLYFNGCQRYFETDDFIPFDKKDSKNIFSKSQEYWVNIIEKTIFRLYNGNKSNSSEISFSLKTNPSYEIYHLTGWLPEIINFDECVNKLSLWHRLCSNFKDGNIIVCLGTNNLKDPVNLYGREKEINIISDHSYPILEAIEIFDKKLLKCKNPWGHTVPNCSYGRKANEDKEYLKELDHGIFWIDWEETIKYFSYIFLAWNPDIYPWKYSFVSSIKNFKSQSKFYDENYSLEYNPQYIITIPEHKDDFEIRILLSKHISQLENNNIYKRKSISFKLFWFEGYNIVYPLEHIRVMQNSKREVNSDVFIFEASSQVEQYVLVITKSDSKENEDNEIFYSLDFHSFIEVDIREFPKPEILKYNKYVDSWDSTKVGGSLTSQNFINNPQYKLSLSHLTHVQIKLETSLMTPIMLCLIENGNHVSKLEYDYINSSKNPGFYFNSFSYLECLIGPGEFNVVCVCQEEKVIGKYSLEINIVKNILITGKSEIKIEKHVVPNYQHIEYLKGKWDEKTNRGCDLRNPKLLIKNPGYNFNLMQLTKCKFILKAATKSGSFMHEYPKVTIYIFKRESDSSLTIIYDGSKFYSSAWGFYSDELLLEPSLHGYALFCVNPNKEKKYRFDLEIHSSYRLIDVVAVKNNNLRKRNFKILGKWDKSNAGGGPNNSTFTNNVFYEINLIKSTTAYIEVTSYDYYKVSFMIFEAPKSKELKSLNELINNIENTIEFGEETISQIKTLNSNCTYFLVAFTSLVNQVSNHLTLVW